MNDQPNPAQFSARSFGAPPSGPSGPNRLLPWVKTAMTGGLIVAAGLYAAQLLLPYDLKPSVVAGRGAGDTVRGEIEASRDAKIDMDRRIADAQAQATAKANTDLAVITKVLEERTNSLAPVSVAAGIADFGCMAAKVVSSMTMPQGWNRQSSDDVYYASQRVGAATCGMGNTIRQGVAESQLEAVRTAAAARGAPMRDGAVRPNQLAPEWSRPLAAIDAVTRPEHHYDYEGTVVKVQEWSQQFPAAVQERLRANLPNDATGWDLFVDRARALDAVIHPT